MQRWRARQHQQGSAGRTGWERAGGRGGVGVLPVEAWPLLAHPLGAKSIIDWLATVTPLQSVSKEEATGWARWKPSRIFAFFLECNTGNVRIGDARPFPLTKTKHKKKKHGCWLDGTSITFKMGKSDSSVPVKPVSHGYRIPIGGEARDTICRLFSCVELKSCRSQTVVAKKPSWFFLFFFMIPLPSSSTAVESRLIWLAAARLPLLPSSSLFFAFGFSGRLAAENILLKTLRVGAFWLILKTECLHL